MLQLHGHSATGARLEAISKALPQALNLKALNLNHPGAGLGSFDSIDFSKLTPSDMSTKMRTLGHHGGTATAATHGHQHYQEIGRKGGEATAATHDHQHYQEIGRANAAKNGSGHMAETGRKGVVSLHEKHGSGHMAETGRKGGINSVAARFGRSGLMLVHSSGDIRQATPLEAFTLNNRDKWEGKPGAHSSTIVIGQIEGKNGKENVMMKQCYKCATNMRERGWAEQVDPTPAAPAVAASTALQPSPAPAPTPAPAPASASATGATKVCHGHSIDTALEMGGCHQQVYW
jgi:general stress protein YciG